MREAEPRLPHQLHRHRADDQQQPPQMRNADHAKAARYQRDHHREVSQGDHLFEHQNQNGPQSTGGDRYEAHERDQVSKPGGPHSQSSSSYWRATWHSFEGSLSRGTKKRVKQRRISIFGESSISLVVFVFLLNTNQLASSITQGQFNHD